MNNEPAPTVFVVDDDQTIRDSLSTLLRTANIKSEMFSDALDFLDRYNPEQAGCLLLDVRMPGMSGLELQQRLTDSGAPLTTIILTGHADVPMAVGAIKAGAADFIEKPFRGEDLIRRVKQAIDQNLEQRRKWDRRRELQRCIDSLTPRETTVLELIVDGHPTKSIATQLGTSFNTVRNQRTSIMRKMKTESVVNLVRMITEMREETQNC